MPKVKTSRAAAKRFKKTGTGQLKRFKAYKIVMLLVLAVFITFLITSIGMYQYFANDKIGNELVISSENNGEISSELSKYRKIIDQYFLGEINEQKLKAGFSAKYHMSISEYTNSIRMTIAENLLSTTQLSIDEISKKLGYNYSSNFVKMFKKTHGKTPLAFRKLKI